MNSDRLRNLFSCNWRFKSHVLAGGKIVVPDALQMIQNLRLGDRRRTRMLVRGDTSMTLRPLQDRVVIRRVAAEEKTAGGILIPDTAQEKPMEGEVVAVGPGARAEDGKVYPLDVGIGDRVLFGKWSGNEIKLDGEELIIVKASDLIGLVEKTSSRRAA